MSAQDACGWQVSHHLWLHTHVQRIRLSITSPNLLAAVHNLCIPPTACLSISDMLCISLPWLCLLLWECASL